MKENSNNLLTDQELINRIRSDNSSKYFEIIYYRYYLKVQDKCYSFVKDRKLAKELAEDVFSKVYEKLPSFKQLSSFSSWLYSITYNFCIDYMREKQKLNYPKWSMQHEIPEIIDETDEFADHIDYDQVMGIMELIHPEEKALLLMKYKDDLSIKQIATALRVSEDAAKMRLKRARARVLYLYSNKYLQDQ